jgi:hypothetical protein
MKTKPEDGIGPANSLTCDAAQRRQLAKNRNRLTPAESSRRERKRIAQDKPAATPRRRSPGNAAPKTLRSPVGATETAPNTRSEQSPKEPALASPWPPHPPRVFVFAPGLTPTPARATKPIRHPGLVIDLAIFHQLSMVRQYPNAAERP